MTEACGKQVQGGIVMMNGEVNTWEALKVEAVPAYNIVHKRNTGQPFTRRALATATSLPPVTAGSMWQ